MRQQTAELKYAHHTGLENGSFSKIYKLLASVFRDIPSIEFIQQLRSPEVIDALASLDIFYDNTFLTCTFDDQLIEELTEEFKALFIGPSDQTSVYESMHHARKDGDWGKLWGADTHKVKKVIEATGLAFITEYGTIPDHISIELEFVAVISQQMELAIKEQDIAAAYYFLKIKKNFFADHLIEWVPQFCDKVMSTAQYLYYPEIARILKCFIEVEASIITEDLIALQQVGRQQ